MPDFQTYLSLATEAAPSIFMSDLVRYVVGAGGVFLIVNALLSRALAGRRIRDHRPGFDQVRRELIASLRTVLIFSGVGFLIWTSLTLGISQVYEDPAEKGWLWFWVSTAILIIGHDAWFYWTHRVMHHPKLFRRFHSLHHRSNNPTPFTSYAFDWREAVINGLYLLLIGLILPVSFLAAFIFTAHMMIRNAIGHCGYELFPRTASGRPLFDWMTTVTHHDLHHAEAGWNYGFYFTFWDRLMGTEHPDYHDRFAAAVRRPRKSRDADRTVEPAALGLVALISLIAAGVAVAPVAEADPAPIEQIGGEWASEGYGVVVQMGPCAENTDTLCGELVWAWDPADVPVEVIGAPMLWGFSFRDGAWREGRLLNPEDGRVYRGSITQRSNDLLDLQGCAARIFCQTQTWRRLSSLPHIGH